VAEAVDEEIGARIHATDDELVAIAFTLMNVHTRDIAGDIGKVLKAGIRYELPGHDAERLWNVDQGRVDLRRRRRAVRIDALRPRARILCPAGGPRRRNPRSSVLRDWRCAFCGGCELRSADRDAVAAGRGFARDVSTVI